MSPSAPGAAVCSAASGNPNLIVNTSGLIHGSLEVKDNIFPHVVCTLFLFNSGTPNRPGLSLTIKTASSFLELITTKYLMARNWSFLP